MMKVSEVTHRLTDQFLRSTFSSSPQKFAGSRIKNKLRNESTLNLCMEYYHRVLHVGNLWTVLKYIFKHVLVWEFEAKYCPRGGILPRMNLTFPSWTSVALKTRKAIFLGGGWKIVLHQQFLFWLREFIDGDTPCNSSPICRIIPFNM